MTQTSVIRPMEFAGSFYTAQPDALFDEIQHFFHAREDDGAEEARTSQPVRPLMVMLPHAGHVYCGTIIGATLNAVSLPSRLILLCPSHTGKGKRLGVWPNGAWQSPIGQTPVDAALATALIQSQAGFEADIDSHMGEHSLEVILPFLQVSVPKLSIVPVSVSVQGPALVEAAKGLAKVMQAEKAAGRELALVVSSDMNHYANHEDTLRLDNLALRHFLALDPVQMYSTVFDHEISMCGFRPATMALLACLELGATHAELVAHNTSAAASGDSSRTVGYAGAYVV